MLREFSRQSGISFDKIYHGDLTPREDEVLAEVRGQMQPVLDRVTFLSEPFDEYGLVEGMRYAEADILIADYLQELFRPSDLEEREAIDSSMRILRGLAKDEKCVLVVSQISRPVAGGSKRGMDRLKGSGQIGYDCHNAFILHPLTGVAGIRLVRLEHIKNRSGPVRDLVLEFEAETHHWQISSGSEKGSAA